MFFKDLKEKTVPLQKTSLTSENILTSINTKNTQPLSLIDVIKKNDEVDDFKKTPLYWTANFIEPLLTAGASINKQDANGVTSVYIAAYNGHVPTVTVLLEAAADASKIIKISCFFSGTALDKDKQNNDCDIVAILEAHFKKYSKGIKPIMTVNLFDFFSVDVKARRLLEA